MNTGSPTFPIIIRKMEAEDLERVKEIDRLSFSQPWPAQSFSFELKNNPAAHMWVAEASHSPENREICAMIVIWLVIDEAHIGTIAVHPTYRRAGIATRLLKYALRSLQQAGASSVFLEVRRSNLSAQSLYENFGFTVSGIRNGYYQDNGEDAFLLTLENLENRDFS